MLALLFSPGYPFFPTTDHLVAALEVLLEGFCKQETEEDQRALIPFIDQFLQYLSAHVSANTKRRKVCIAA